jgi:polysaccharide biosynthesis protein PslH
MNVLWITDWPPDPLVGGAQSIYYHLLTRVAQRHRVSLLSLVRSSEERQRAEALGALCEHVATVDHWRCPRGLTAALTALAQGQPSWNRAFWSQGLADAVSRISRERPIDVVQIEHAHMAPYVHWLSPASRARRVLVLHNLGPILWRRMWRVEQRPLQKVRYLLDWMMSRSWERVIAGRFDACVTLSAHDRTELLRAAPQARCEVVRHGIDVDSLTPLPRDHASRTLLMVGNMAYAPNRDGVLFFCEHVLPRVRVTVPEARLTVVGGHPPAELSQRMPPGVVDVTGFVDSVVPYYRAAALVVVPLRAGSGVRGKILEAMALGRPVVSTAVGCEGLDVTHGEHLMIADDPGDFAACVARVLQEPALWQRLAENGRRYVEQAHTWDASAGSLLHLYDALTGSGGR